MEADELKKLSDNAFFDNDRGLIKPAAHRNFNNQLIEFIGEGAIFTYVVDSDQKLSDWADNKAGNDYTSVFIKKGTWNVSKAVNVEASNTAIVVGAGGSVLRFRGGYGLSASANYETKLLFNITLEFASSIAIGFDYCRNLSHCKVICPRSFDEAYNFCSNLFSCTVQIMSDSFGESVCFMNCSYLTQCYLYTRIFKHIVTFKDCNNLSNCWVDMKNTSNVAYLIGFYMCNYLSNCSAKCDSGFAGVAFYKSGHITQCYALGKGTGDVTSAFNGCTKLIGCVADPNSNVKYKNCSMKADGTGEISDTAAGGWNE